MKKILPPSKGSMEQQMAAYKELGLLNLIGVTRPLSAAVWDCKLYHIQRAIQ